MVLRASRFALLRNLRATCKSGELAVLMLALLVAVAALTAVGFFTSRVGRAVEQQAGEVLAADLRLQSRAADRRRLRRARRRGAGLRAARLSSMPSVVFYGEDSALAAMRAVGAGYPLRGRLKDRGRAVRTPARDRRDTGPRRGLGGLAAARATRRAASATLSVGAHEFAVTRVLDYRPDQGSGFVDLAPTLLINLADLPATGAHPAGQPRQLRGCCSPASPAAGRGIPRVAARKQAAGRTAAVDRRCEPADPLLRRIAPDASCRSRLVSVLLAAIAVAMAARRYARAAPRHRRADEMHGRVAAPRAAADHVAQLRRDRGRGGVVGAVLGYVGAGGIAWLLRDLVRGDLPPPARRRVLARAGRPRS